MKICSNIWTIDFKFLIILNRLTFGKININNYFQTIRNSRLHWSEDRVISLKCTQNPHY